MKHHNISRFDTGYPFNASYRENRNSLMATFSEFYAIAKEQIINTTTINIVCRGSSGCFVAAILFEMLFGKPELYGKDINIVYVRKDRESSHSSNSISGYIKSEALFIWVDDFIDEGETIKLCHQELKNVFASYGSYLPDEWKFDWAVCTYAHEYGFIEAENYTNNLVCYSDNHQFEASDNIKVDKFNI